jgi:hypothetical protein
MRVRNKLQRRRKRRRLPLDTIGTGLRSLVRGVCAQHGVECWGFQYFLGRILLFAISFSPPPECYCDRRKHLIIVQSKNTVVF